MPWSRDASGIGGGNICGFWSFDPENYSRQPRKSSGVCWRFSSLAIGLERPEFLLSSLKILPGFFFFTFTHCDFSVFLKRHGGSRILPLRPGLFDLTRDILIHQRQTVVAAFSATGVYHCD